MRTVRQFLGVKGKLKVTSKRGAEVILKDLASIGVVPIANDGTPFDWRFLRNRPDFIELAELAIESVLERPVEEE